MNLQPFYELRERLFVSAAAGTQFVQEDFRLRETAKKVEVFAKASPVFAKMSQMLGQLMEGEKEKRSEVLLDLLGLLDAFLTTQGSSQTDGELLPVVEEGRAQLPAKDGAAYQEIPYSRLQPIKWALTETGSSRQSTLAENYEREPELFMDFRICPLMIKALGDAYAEIGDMVCDWLIKIGEPVIPLLKEGFDPKGKKEMVRRVRVISEIAGAKENAFYCAKIPESEKDVKEALIRALRYSQENRQLLFDLVKAEKGKMRMAVQWVLGFMEGEEAAQYWEKRAAANPVETAQLLKTSDASYAPAILAGLVRQDGEALLQEEEERAKRNKEEKKTKTDKQEMEKLRIRDEKFKHFIYACAGKVGREICEMLEWTAKEKELKRFQVLFASMMTQTIMETPLEREGARDYYRLAEQLFQQAGREYARPAFAACLFSASSAEAYDRFSGHTESMGYSVFRVLQRIFYEEGTGYYIRTEEKTDEKGNAYLPGQIRVLENGFDLRWYSLIIEKRRNCPGDFSEVQTSFRGADAVLYRLLRRDIPDLCQQYGEYFYHMAITGEPTVSHVQVLVRCGWTKFDHILVQAAKKNVWYYQLRQLIEVLPITREQLIKEMELIQTYWNNVDKKNSSYGRNASNSALIKKWLEILHNGGTVYDLL